MADDILAFGPAETRDVEATSIPTLTTCTPLPRDFALTSFCSRDVASNRC